MGYLLGSKKVRRAIPSNTSIKELLGDERYTVTALEFLANTRLGEAKEGAWIGTGREFHHSVSVFCSVS